MVDYSWSQKLFLQVNAHVGRSKSLDFLMRFCARWLIIIFFVFVLFFHPFFLGASVNAYSFFGVLTTGVMTALALNFSLGLSWKHDRPVIEFPDSKQLCKTWQTWKSFPSDHTSLSFILAFTIWAYSARLGIAIIAFILAILISASRVYAGVHYPKDILGGLLSALVSFLVSPWLYQTFNLLTNYT